MDDRTRFDWDYHKNEINKRKHKVSFYEAMTCFFDDNALILYDDNHSAYEDRFIRNEQRITRSDCMPLFQGK